MTRLASLAFALTVFSTTQAAALTIGILTVDVSPNNKLLSITWRTAGMENPTVGPAQVFNKNGWSGTLTATGVTGGFNLILDNPTHQGVTLSDLTVFLPSPEQANHSDTDGTFGAHGVDADTWNLAVNPDAVDGFYRGTISGQHTGDAVPIPEPTTALLVAAGLAGLGARARRVRRPCGSG